MAGGMGTFKRFEMKYIMDARQYAAFCKAVAPYTQPDEYGQYTVCNIYYDTDNYAIIRQSIDKPVYKEKLRVRSYGIPGAEDEVFFELKKKYKREVFKRRVSMRMQDLNSHLANGTVPDVSKQVMSEIDYFMALYHPQPKIYIAYDRTALKGKEDESLRITFDQNIRFRCDDLDLTSGDHGCRILDDSQYVVEIKVHGAMPLWLSGALDTQKIYPASFSKYGYCYEHYIGINGAQACLPEVKKQVA